MQRRSFLITCGAICAPSIFSARTLAATAGAKSVVIQDAYMLWYIRPSIVETNTGFTIAYTTPSGDLYAMNLSKNLQKGPAVKLHSFVGVSDHSAPSIVRIPSGPFAGHFVVFFSNHSSELFAVRSKKPDSIESWETVRLLDNGRATYPAPFVLRDGTIGLQYTLQHRDNNEQSIQWRTTVHRFTRDGGTTWTEASTLLDFGHSNFPYSTPVAVSKAGHCALAYSVHSWVTKRNHGLRIVISEDGFASTRDINVVLDTGTHGFIPYELKWKDSETLMLSYSISKGHNTHASSAVAFISTTKRRIHRYNLGPVAMHNYPGGAALLPDSDSVVYSPLRGGLILRDLGSGRETELSESGGFASPFVFHSTTGDILVALQNPSIKSPTDFRADLLIQQLTI